MSANGKDYVLNMSDRLQQCQQSHDKLIDLKENFKEDE